jgi:predicted nucleic acid-binding protein
LVWNEVLKHRPQALPQAFITLVLEPQSPDAKLAALCQAFSLDAGEGACLALLRARGGTMFLTDDAAARLVAVEMGIEVHGTIGVLVRSVRRGKRTAEGILQLLDELPNRSTLFIENTLLEDIKGNLRKEWRLGG